MIAIFSVFALLSIFLLIPISKNNRHTIFETNNPPEVTMASWSALTNVISTSYSNFRKCAHPAINIHGANPRLNISSCVRTAEEISSHPLVGPIINCSNCLIYSHICLILPFSSFLVAQIYAKSAIFCVNLHSNHFNHLEYA